MFKKSYLTLRWFKETGERVGRCPKADNPKHPKPCTLNEKQSEISEVHTKKSKQGLHECPSEHLNFSKFVLKENNAILPGNLMRKRDTNNNEGWWGFKEDVLVAWKILLSRKMKKVSFWGIENSWEFENDQRLFSPIQQQLMKDLKKCR